MVGAAFGTEDSVALTCASSIDLRRSSAGPGKGFGAPRESGFYRVVFDPGADAFEFPRVADPLTVRFLLPEGVADSGQHAVRTACADALERFQQVAGRDLGAEKYVDVVGHDYPGV